MSISEGELLCFFLILTPVLIVLLLLELFEFSLHIVIT